MVFSALRCLGLGAQRYVVVQHFQPGRNLEQILDVIDDHAERAALIEEAFDHLSHAAVVERDPEPA